MSKSKKQTELEQQIGELTADLQRLRADFENYRKIVDVEKQAARESGQTAAIIKLLPVIDNIERAISHAPKDLQDNSWVQGIISLVKNLEQSLEALDLKRVKAEPGTEFNPELHEAVIMEEGEGDEEVIAEELQPGYILGGTVIRPAIVKVRTK